MTNIALFSYLVCYGQASRIFIQTFDVVNKSKMMGTPCTFYWDSTT